MKEIAVDGVKCHGKRFFGSIILTSSLTCCSFAIPFLTNATKIVKYSKAVHSVCAAAWRGAHNLAEAPILLIDYAVFGEAIPSCGEADYDIFSNNTTDFLSEFTK